MNRPTKLFVIEGEDKELRFLESLVRVFFKGKYDAQVISLPAKGNIYMLYNIMQEDGFESDIVEVLRENVDDAAQKLQGITRQNIDEVFLFFDFDLHQNNLPASATKEPLEILTDLISFFDNETENGKLYVSYPMFEATYDFVIDECAPFTQCYLPLEQFAEYKNLSGNNNPVASWHYNSYPEWEEVIKVFALRIQCLFNRYDIGYEFYRNQISTANVLTKQIDLIETTKKVFVLSACAEFLLDYFNESFWVKHFRATNDKLESCKERK